MRSADPRAGEHRDNDLGNHRQVDPDHIALRHAEVLQRAGEALDLPEQLGVGDVALGAVLAAPVKRDALAAPRLDVPVEAVVGDVELAADEPFVERRIGVVEHRVPLLKPVQPLGLRHPPALRVACRLLVDRGVFQQRVLAKLARGVERLDIEQSRELAVECLSGERLVFSCHAPRPLSSKFCLPRRQARDPARTSFYTSSARAGSCIATLPAQRPLNGTTGSTVRPNVEFATAANDAYQAAAAVARPR